MEKEDIKNLKKRYLIWLYKTTRESIDRIERKFTQLDIDRFILAELESLDKKRELGEQIAKWDAYIHRKEQDGASLKFEDQAVNKECRFLELKLIAVEKAVVHVFGKKTLLEIKEIYEHEMVDRILTNSEH